jgi:capsular exopolysaccharide synthesis family protein
MKQPSSLPLPDGVRPLTADREVALARQWGAHSPPTLSHESENGLVREISTVLWQRKGTLSAAILLGILLSIGFTLWETPTFQANGSLEIQNVNENFLNMQEISPTNVGNDGSSPLQNDLQTEIKLLQSRSVINRVVTDLDLERRLTPSTGAHYPWWRKLTHLRGRQPASQREQALENVSKELSVSTEAGTRLINISFDSKDPQLATNIVNDLMDQFIRESLEARRQGTEQTGVWLTQQMQELRGRLEKSEDALESYAYSSGLLFTSQKVGSQVVEDNVANEKLRQLQDDLSVAHSDRVAKQSTYDMVSSAPLESLPEVLDDKSLADYHVKLTDLRRQRSALSATLTPAHPEVRRIDAQIATLEAASEKERADVVQRMHDEYASALRRENLLSANYVSQASLVSDQAAKVAHYNILKSDVDTDRELYNTMLRELQEASMTAALHASNMRVVDPATVPTRPYKPSVPLNLALGTFAGAFLGTIWIVMRDRADRSIRAPGQAQGALGIPELGVIPSRDAEAGRLFSRYRRARGANELLIDYDNPSPRVELITSPRSPSALADCFRSAATSMLYAGESAAGMRVIALTSARPRDGKTTVASNLALALAEAGSAVLLIDGDLRKGRLHEIFQVPNTWGMSDLLAGKKLPQGRDSAYVATCYERIYLLPSGSTPVSIAGLLHSPRALEFVDKMRSRFDTIIIDTPPMLQMPDARVLGRLADGVILVLRSAQTTRQEAAAAVQRLSQDGTRVIGTILNEWDPKTTSQYAYANTCERMTEGA